LLAMHVLVGNARRLARSENPVMLQSTNSLTALRGLGI